MVLVVRCVNRKCGFKKALSEEVSEESPCCEHCGSPMIPVKAVG